MDNRRNKIFWSLHEHLMMILDLKAYYLSVRDYENYDLKTEETIVTIDCLQRLLHTEEDAVLHVTSYFD